MATLKPGTQQTTHTDVIKHWHHRQPFPPLIPPLFELLLLAAADTFDWIFS
jgi:hypothetical protein